MNMPTTISSKDLTERLSKRLANFKLKDDEIKKLADRVLLDGLHIGKLDPCIYGICIDYWSDKLPDLSGLRHRHGVARWEVFPYGIIDWDRFHVRVAFEMEGMQPQFNANGGF